MPHEFSRKVRFPAEIKLGGAKGWAKRAIPDGPSSLPSGRRDILTQHYQYNPGGRATAVGFATCARFSGAKSMNRAKKALILMVVSTLGLWGCAKGPAPSPAP